MENEGDEAGAELILDDHNDDNDEYEEQLANSNVSIANAMLEEQKMIRNMSAHHRQQRVDRGGGYNLRKFLSTPYQSTTAKHLHHQAGIDSRQRSGGEGGVESASSLSSAVSAAILRRAPSYDPNLSSFDNDDDEFHDNPNHGTNDSMKLRGKDHNNNDNDDESPLFRNDVEIRLADHHHHYSKRNERSGSGIPQSQHSNEVIHSLSDPVAFQRNPLSFRGKNSELLLKPSSSFRKEDHQYQHQDDLSTVAESVESSLDHDLKKQGTSSSKLKHYFSWRRSVAVSSILLVICLCGEAIFAVSGRNKDEGVAANHLQVVSSTMEEKGGAKINDIQSIASYGEGGEGGNVQSNFGTQSEYEQGDNVVEEVRFTMWVRACDIFEKERSKHEKPTDGPPTLNPPSRAVLPSTHYTLPIARQSLPRTPSVRICTRPTLVPPPPQRKVDLHRQLLLRNLYPPKMSKTCPWPQF